MLPNVMYLLIVLLAGALIILGNEMYQRIGWFLFAVMFLFLLVNIAEDTSGIMWRVYRISVITGDTP